MRMYNYMYEKVSPISFLDWKSPTLDLISKSDGLDLEDCKRRMKSQHTLFLKQKS